MPTEQRTADPTRKKIAYFTVTINIIDTGQANILDLENGLYPYAFAITDALRSEITQLLYSTVGDDYSIEDFSVERGSVIVTFAVAAVAFFKSPVGEMLLDISRFDAFAKSVEKFKELLTPLIKKLFSNYPAEIISDASWKPASAVAGAGGRQAEPVDERSRDKDLTALRERLTRREGGRNLARISSRNGFMGSSTAFLLAVILELLAAGPKDIALTNPTYVAIARWGAILAMFCGAIALVVAFADRVKTREYEADITQLEFQIDLVSHELSQREFKAEKLLRLNDFQLRRYYDLNLYQNRRVFNLGIGCIIGGVLIIIATLHELHLQKDSSDITLRIATAALGAIGALLTNYVAAIYLKMNAAASENLASFHARLVETHQLMLGNLLASRIDDDNLRWNTLSLLAQKLVPGK
jgi:hypothetical protein